MRIFLFRLVSIFFLIIILHIKCGATYYGFFDVTAFNQRERSLLYKLHIEDESLVFLNSVTNEAALPMQVIVEDCCIDIFQNTLEENGVENSRIHIKPREENDTFELPTNYDGKIIGFLRFKSIISWINQQQKTHPILKKQILALTYEKREVFFLSLVKNKDSPIVVIVGGEQGKDWMSVAIILALLNSFLKDEQLQKLLDLFSFYFVPIMNPDGYVYSMEKDEFWAKNRKVFYPKRKCDWPVYHDNNLAVGVNLERNWYYEKILNTHENICNSVYMGHKPLSEEETKGLSIFLNKHAVKLMAFINVIGYGNRLITLPFAHTMQYSINHGVVMDIIMSACERLQKEHNATYFNGQSAQFLYNFSGNCADWVKYKLNVPLVYTVYMKYKDESIPHPKDIIPLSQQLATILEETLTIGKEIYGPLFNSINLYYNNTSVIILMILLIWFI